MFFYYLTRDCRTVQVAKDIRRSLIQSPVQSRVINMIRPGCSFTRSVLKNSKDGDYVTSLDNLFHCFSVHIVKKFLQTSSGAGCLDRLYNVHPWSFLINARHHCEKPRCIFLITSSQVLESCY